MKPVIYYTCQELRTRNAYQALQLGDLRGEPVYMDVYTGDPVTSGRHIATDGGWEWIGPAPRRPMPADPDDPHVPPECSRDCKWRSTIGHDRQRNALRCELAHLVSEHRCGWNLKPGHLGGRPLDYAPCDYPLEEVTTE